MSRNLAWTRNTYKMYNGIGRELSTQSRIIVFFLVVFFPDNSSKWNIFLAFFWAHIRSVALSMLISVSMNTSHDVYLVISCKPLSLFRCIQLTLAHIIPPIYCRLYRQNEMLKLRDFANQPKDVGFGASDTRWSARKREQIVFASVE